MKERILGISNLLISAAIILSYFFFRNYFFKVLAAGEFLILLLYIFLYETDVDYGCLVLIPGYSVLFPAYITVHSFLGMKEHHGKERFISILGFVVSVAVLLIILFAAFRGDPHRLQ